MGLKIVLAEQKAPYADDAWQQLFLRDQDLTVADWSEQLRRNGLTGRYRAITEDGAIRTFDIIEESRYVCRTVD